MNKIFGPFGLRFTTGDELAYVHPIVLSAITVVVDPFPTSAVIP